MNVGEYNALTGEAARTAWGKIRRYGRDGRACPRRIIGWRCLAAGGPRREYVTCLCEDWSGLLAHSEAWRTPEGGLIVTGEPYHVPTDDPRVSAFREALVPYGLAVEASEDSPHAPGLTTLIVVKVAPRPAGRVDDGGFPVVRGYVASPRGFPVRLMVWCRWACRWYAHDVPLRRERPPYTAGELVAETHDSCGTIFGEHYPHGYMVEVQDAPFAEVKQVPQIMRASQTDALIAMQWSRRPKFPHAVKHLRDQPEPMPGGPAATYAGIIRGSRRLGEVDE